MTQTNINGTVIFGKENCVFCERAKKLLDGLRIQYTYRDAGNPNTRAELLELVPGAKTVPQIWLYGTYVGGWEDLVSYIEDHAVATGGGSF